MSIENLNISIIIEEKNLKKAILQAQTIFKKFENSIEQIIIVNKKNSNIDNNKIKFCFPANINELYQSINSTKILYIKQITTIETIEKLISNQNLKEKPYINYYQNNKLTSIIEASLLKIDLVYTWVDDNDKNWQEKKQQYDTSNYNKDAIDKCRFINNDELKYSLRSVQKYIPWINNIFIVTDNQKPSWLNLNNEKIRIIDHKDIIPNDKLPTYNACTIENAIPYIKELSEYFLYANDDMMFFKKTPKSFFFSSNKPIVRVKEKIKKYKKYKHLYGAMVYKAYSLAKEKYNKSYPYFSHHNIDGYKKSTCLECINEFKDEFEKTTSNRFRDISDIQRMIISYYALAKNKAVLKNTNQNILEKIFKKTSDSEYMHVKAKTLKKLSKLNTHLICLNDSRKTTDKDRKQLKQILETEFSEKSEFEVQDEY